MTTAIASPIVFSDCDTASMQAFMLLTMPERVAISRPAADSSDGLGGQIASAYTIVATKRPAFVVDMTTDERASVAHITTKTVRKIFFPVGEDVRMKDRIVWNGRTLDVIQVIGGGSYDVLDEFVVVEVS